MKAERGRSVHESGALTQPQPRESFPASGLQALSPDPVQVPFAVGEVIAGKYEVTGLLGSGGMGYVISARHVELGEMVALKFLRPEALVHPELVERFAREARAAAKIRGEHVANVFDVGTLSDGTPFIVMECLAGSDLADHLRQQGPLPIPVAVEYVMQACEALAAAHSHGIIHRDIKPENLFLTRQTQGMSFIKVLDFGISKVALPRGKRDLVRTQMALGSPVYMSPEQIRRSDQVDARSDIWAVGCVLFELLTGVTAFDESSLLELSAAILERDPVPLQTLRPEASEELEAVVLRCLAKAPEDRFQNVAELAIALYPFGPRRARISAERCYHMLKNSGAVSSELELSSAYPPSMTSLKPAPSAQSSADIPRTTTAAAADLLAAQALPRSQNWGRKIVLFGAPVVLIAAAMLLASPPRGAGQPTPASATRSERSRDRTAPAKAAPETATSAEVRRPATPPSNVTLGDPIPPPRAVAARSAKAMPAASSPKAGPGKPVPKPAARAKAFGATSKGPRSSDDDLDPGF